MSGAPRVDRARMQELLGFAPSDEQWAAISAPLAGATLVVAGAGSGKTTVMAARVAWLVGNGLVAAHEVLGLTFMNKAAGELGQRVRRMLEQLDTGDDPVEPTVQTYDSFAADLLAEWGVVMGVEPGTTLADPTDLSVLTYRDLSEVVAPLEQLGSSAPASVARRLLRLDGELSEHLVDPEELQRHDGLLAAAAPDTPQAAARVGEAARRRMVAAQAVAELRAARAASGVASFADRSREAARVAGDEHVRQSLRSRFRVVLLDEYQDTSVAQRHLLSTVFGAGHPLLAVGDPLQAIYGWRGASVSNIDHFGEHFGGPDLPVRVLPLSVNRRSDRVILQTANDVAAELRRRHPVSRPLVPGNPDPGQVRAALFETVDDEAEWLVAQIARQLEVTPPGEVAILCRRNRDVRRLALRLRSAGIPVSVGAVATVLELPECRDVVNMIKVVDSPVANTAMIGVLTNDKWRIGPADLAALGRRARALSRPAPSSPRSGLGPQLAAAVPPDASDVPSLLAAVADPDESVSPEARRRLAGLMAEIAEVRAAARHGIQEAVDCVVEVSGLSVEARLGVDAESRLDALSVLHTVVAGYRRSHLDSSVRGFLRWLEVAESMDSLPEADLPVGDGAVHISTVHRAKGLEWDVVFVPGLCDGIFPDAKARTLWTTNWDVLPTPLRGDRVDLPHWRSWSYHGGRGDLAGPVAKDLKQLTEDNREHSRWEEERLGYVALTRARHRMYLSGYWWGSRAKPHGPGELLTRAIALADVVADPWQAEPEHAVNPLTQGGDVAWPPEVALLTVPPAVAQEPPLSEGEARLLAEIEEDCRAVRAQAAERQADVEVRLPDDLTVSQAQRALSDPEGFAADLIRPMPLLPSRGARRGTAFHEWVARRHEQLSLLPEWEGAVDAEIVSDAELEVLKQAFERTAFADRAPIATEVPVAVRLGGVAVRGVIDAVYPDGRGGYEVVDWKTHREQTADPVQLAIYRLAWARHAAVEPERVSACFVYVRTGRIVRPGLLDEAELTARLAGRGGPARPR